MRVSSAQAQRWVEQHQRDGIAHLGNWRRPPLPLSPAQAERSRLLMLVDDNFMMLPMWAWLCLRCAPPEHRANLLAWLDASPEFDDAAIVAAMMANTSNAGPRDRSIMQVLAELLRAHGQHAPWEREHADEQTR